MTNNSCRYHKPRWVFTDIRDTGWQGENVHTEERLYHRQNGEEETRRNEEKITNRWWMWIWFYSLTFLNYAMMHVFLSYFENLRVWILAIEFQLNLKLYITYTGEVACEEQLENAWCLVTTRAAVLLQWSNSYLHYCVGIKSVYFSISAIGYHLLLAVECWLATLPYISYFAHIIVNWLDHGKTLREQSVTEGDTLLLKRKLFFSDQNIDARDPIQLNLLYVQVKCTLEITIKYHVTQ